MQNAQAAENTSENKNLVLQSISDPAIILTPEEIGRYLTHKESEGCVAGTIDVYRRNMQLFYRVLPEDKIISKGTIRLCKEHLMAQDYAQRTLNVFVSVANSYLEYKGVRQYQLLEKATVPEDMILPEITRAEHLRLLSTARILGRERVYLLVKLFATTGFPLQELPKVTVESVRAGMVSAKSNGVEQMIQFPDFLQRELLSYANRRGILSGPVFLTRSGEPMSRTNVSMGIRQLCAAAQVPEEKGNPRCLRKLYLSARAEIEANIIVLIEQAVQQQLEAEQAIIGWEKV